MPSDKFKATKYSGVFTVDHPSRTWLPDGKKTFTKDRRIMLRYTINGKTYKGSWGWESQGSTILDAANKIETFRKNAEAGIGSICLRDEKEELSRQQEEAQLALQHEASRNVTLAEYFKEHYLPSAKTNKKAATVVSEEALFKKWIEPTMGSRRIRDILPLDFERLKNKVLKGDRRVDEHSNVTYVPKSPRTVHYCVSIVVQVWNMAFDNKVVDVQPPRRKTLNLPIIDNERTRAFSPEQARAYFEKMDSRSSQWANITRASLFAGLRASEVFKLEIKHFDAERGKLFLKSPKKQKSQTLVLNDSAQELFKRLREEHPTKKGLFFTIDRGERKGEPITEVSNTVQRAIDDLGFNTGVTDRRDRLTFHSWRHTYATWLLDKGTDIYTVSQLLRHSNLAMTRRYVHPHEDKLRNAAKGIDDIFNSQEENTEVEVESTGETGAK